jgi:spore germination protein GerM
MRSRWWCTGAALVALAAAACGVSVEDEPRVADDESVPFALLSPNAPTLVPPATAAASEPVTLFFIAADKLRGVERPLDSPVSIADVVTALSEPPQDDTSLRSAVGSPPLVAGLKLAAGVAQIDLAPSVASLGGDTQLLAIAQLVCTLTARPGIGQVSFTLGGQPVDVPRGDGTLTSGAVSRDDYTQLLS